MTTAPERYAQALALLVERAALRIPVHGRSMFPILRVPMIVDVGPLGTPNIGDVLVFRYGGRIATHRLIAIDGDVYCMAGDAQPTRIERVPGDDIIGRVIAVWSDSSPQAVRVDGRAYRLWGSYVRRAQPLRSRVARVRMNATELAQRADPRTRIRTMPHFIDALTGVVRDDREVLRAALSAAGEGLAAAAERHRCVALLGDALRRHGGEESVSPAIAAALRSARLAAVLATSRMHRRVSSTVATMRETGFPFALLKGAARVYAGASDAAAHTSNDLDVLVRTADRDDVVRTLLARGYTVAPIDPTEPDFRYHHHAEPLLPPHGAFPLEVHHQLAAPSALSTATDWDALSTMLTPIAGDAGTALQLDDTGTALHLAIHAIGMTRLRDVVLLAQTLRRLEPPAVANLAALSAAESRDPVRLQASFALAARLAGIPWTALPQVERYLRWVLQREDLPRSVRMRCDAVEAYFAYPRRPAAWLWALVPLWSRGRDVVKLPVRIAARCVASAAAIAYLAAWSGAEV